jgi:hypothetical protein
MGDKSTPVIYNSKELASTLHLEITHLTSASGCSSPKSIAQIPVPVPRSRTRLTSESGRFGGERPSLLSKVRRNKLCCKSRLLEHEFPLRYAKGQLYLACRFLDHRSEGDILCVIDVSVGSLDHQKRHRQQLTSILVSVVCSPVFLTVVEDGTAQACGRRYRILSPLRQGSSFHSLHDNQKAVPTSPSDESWSLAYNDN